MKFPGHSFGTSVPRCEHSAAMQLHKDIWLQVSLKYLRVCNQDTYTHVTSISDSNICWPELGRDFSHQLQACYQCRHTIRITHDVDTMPIFCLPFPLSSSFATSLSNGLLNPPLNARELPAETTSRLKLRCCAHLPARNPCALSRHACSVNQPCMPIAGLPAAYFSFGPPVSPRIHVAKAAALEAFWCPAPKPKVLTSLKSVFCFC